MPKLKILFKDLFAINVFYFDHGVQDFAVYDYHFYVVLFSGLKQTPCAPVASDSKSILVFIACFEYPPKWCI